MNPLQTNMERQLLLGLRTAAQAFVLIYLASIVLWGVLWVLPASPKAHLTAATGRFNYAAGELYMLFVGLAEAAVAWWIGRALREQRSLSKHVSYVLAFLEAFQPTFFLWLWGQILPPAEALAQSPIFFYFLLISAGVLRMNPAASFWSGLVAGGSYVGLAWWLSASAGSADPWLDVTSLHLTKGVYLVVCGSLMALVARQMRLRLVATLEAESREQRAQELLTLAVLRERDVLDQDRRAQKALGLAEPGSRLAILDSHDVFRESFRGLLRQIGYQVTGAWPSVEAALPELAVAAPELVLVDQEFEEDIPPGLRLLVLGAPEPGLARLAKSSPTAHLVACIEAALAGKPLPQAPHLAPVDRLSPRQREILTLVSQGLTYKEVGVKLHLAERTIKFHMGEVFALLGVRNKAEAVLAARAQGK
ncbi:MAG: response regulator transcription factor [Spirochaetales bacterium]